MEKLIVSEADITSRCRCINVPGSYMIFPRANRVEHYLPHFNGVEAQVLSTPQHGARFVEHELLVAPGGGTEKPRDEEFEQFLFILEADCSLRRRASLTKWSKAVSAGCPLTRLMGLKTIWKRAAGWSGSAGAMKR